MQAEEHYHERIWGDYPALDKLLSNNQPSMHWHGPTSLSHNIFNKVEDLLSVYALVADQFDEIQRLSRKTENDDLGRDIAKLSEHLSWMSEFFREASYKAKKILM